MKKIYLAAVLLVGVFFMLPSPPTMLSAKETKQDLLDSCARSMQVNIDYVKQKLQESKEDLKFIKQKLK